MEVSSPVSCRTTSSVRRRARRTAQFAKKVATQTRLRREALDRADLLQGKLPLERDWEFHVEYHVDHSLECWVTKSYELSYRKLFGRDTLLIMVYTRDEWSTKSEVLYGGSPGDLIRDLSPIHSIDLSPTLKGVLLRDLRSTPFMWADWPQREELVALFHPFPQGGGTKN